jgi:hypothetical protein
VAVTSVMVNALAWIFFIKLCASRLEAAEIASMQALYTFTVDPYTVASQVVERIAVVFGRSSEAYLTSNSFSVIKFEGLSSSGCELLSLLPSVPIDGTTIGCNRVHLSISDTSDLTEYEIRYFTELFPYRFARLASSTSQGFTAHVPPSSLEGPSYTWFGGSEFTNTTFATWRQFSFPQDAWTKKTPSCVSGTACEDFNMAPSARYHHSAVVYKSWNFERDVLNHPYLCNLGSGNSECTETCLTDYRCFGAPSWDYYYSNNMGSYLWGNSKQFVADDGSSYPYTEMDSADCPPSCCGTRRLCMRTKDDIGRHVPFDRSYMLIFGGRTRQKKILSNGLDVYLDCVEMLRTGDPSDQTYASCLEYQSDELWRFDISEKNWELLKPRAADGTSFPPARFGHASALVIIDAANDLQQTRRQYLFVLGGFSTDCDGGLCTDLWRYEVPWAAQAFWPATSQSLSQWTRGNTWKRLKDCPIGGLYRHTMVATESGTSLIVYGGQQAGKYSNKVLIYTLSSDSWEIKDAVGNPYFTRSVVDYTGKSLTRKIFDFSKFDDRYDQLGPTVTDSIGGNVPLDRGDHCAVMKSDGSMVMMNGFRTYKSPYPDVSHIPFPSYPYYMQKDMWEYNVSQHRWEQLFPSSLGDVPLDRRGASLVELSSGELLLFGGSRGDSLFGDFWTFKNKIWRKISKWNSTLPPSLVHHSMVYDETTDQLLLLGGLRWTEADLKSTDALLDADRRCKMAALNVLAYTCETAECALSKAKQEIADRCTQSSSDTKFCCLVDLTVIQDLTALSNACLAECNANVFESKFSAFFGQGLWVMSPNSCANDCSGNGVCELSICKCRPGFTGSDCSVKQCLGTFCYFDSFSMDQRCVECSSNGSCKADGTCECQEGWTGTDCSTSVCKNGCSGVCLEQYQFPLHQCVCGPGRSGLDCSDQLCLNACSGRGTCTSSGACECEIGFHGEDCSVYAFSAAGAQGRSVWLIAALLVVLF